ncbi:DUF554 domain-containing protein [Pasteurella bettyae]|uniref:PF04474 family protein n=1 Tax=Pasteurella bettyae CCUG 2042 TaxID=1095749 RepID=I3DIX4_9PAST|nr:DUF554 domain-containing protein [Pasteurella bettyae]EIJ71667.1 PF04474 family protein [Pasteurella bettyae CCUG 2042]SUB22298.1 Protein of uncharacterised function (DUF554) [Pasteurella bettyae]
MIIGPYINAVAIITGALIGAALGGRVPERLRNNLTLLFGLCSMSMGIVMIAKVANMPAMILALLLGTIIGEIILLESGINRIASSAKVIIEKIFPNNEKKGLSYEEFLQKFVGIIILFSFSGTGIFGAMNEGLTGDNNILIIKAFLDFLTAMIFATSLGMAVATAAIPQTILQVILAYCAIFIIPLITPEMRADFAAAGGMIMVATGFRICGLKNFQIANMLPALFIVMPISALWIKFMV